MARLRITTPDGHSWDHTLVPGRTVIGRGTDCQVVVDHPTLSRQHAAVEFEAGVWIVMDLGSKNGIRVEGRPVMRAPLRPGDHFRCGKAEFEFSGEAVTPDDLPTRISPAHVPQVPPAPGAPGIPKGPRAEHAPDDEITTEIPDLSSRKTLFLAMAGLGGLAAAGLLVVFIMYDGGAKQERPPVPVANAPAKPEPVAPPADPEPEPVKPAEVPKRALQDPEEPRDGEVRVRFRDGTARVGKVVSRTKFEIEVECVVSGKPVRESYGIEEVLKVGDETMRPDWGAIFARKLEAAKTETALRALEAWCRKYGYADGRELVVELLASGTEAPAKPTAVTAKSKTVRYAGRDRDPEELRAEGKLDPRGRLVLSADELRYTRDVHFDLLGRSPTEDDVQRAAAETRAGTVDRLLRSVECFETWYEEEVYYFLLLDNFRPATDRMVSIPKKLSAGAMTIPDAIHEIVICQYFNHRNPGNDTYVTVILEQLLGMVVQDQPMLLKVGKQMYDGYEGKLFGETGRNQADLVSIVMKQKRFHELVLERLHKRIAGAAIRPNVLANNVERVVADPKAFHEVMKEWMLDDAYIARASKLRKKSDHQFIRGLYTDLLGRRATYDEFRLFRNALQALADPTPIRSVLAKVMVDSEQVKAGKVGDSGQWVKDLYARMLGRMPNEKELAVFAPVVKDGKPKLAIQAIVDSEEYQHY
ncbi:MAG: FHA domain-containing protein [Planctomycetota bacterium]